MPKDLTLERACQLDNEDELTMKDVLLYISQWKLCCINRTNDLFKNMATSKGTKYLTKIQVIHNKNIYQARKALFSTW